MKFTYEVNGNYFYDNNAFGEAWKEAKKTATECHCAIYRWVDRGDRVDHEVYYSGGCFNSVRFATESNVKIF